MSIIKVMMYPHPEAALNGESGIHTILRKYIQHFPTADIEFVHPKADSFDVLAVHAGTANEFGDGPMVAHLHGLYWTADYDCALWEYKANESVISNMLSANCVTVPSEWVAQNIRRATRINPYVLPHGIDWQEWKTDISGSGYVLWNKNRAADVCDPTPVKKLAERFPGVNFVSTFAPEGSPSNVKTTGLIPHEQMKAVVKSAGVYLSTPKETFGIGMLEALASGVPVLAFREGGALQLVDHCGTGYLAKPGDMDDLARGLEYCIKHRDILSRNAMMSVRQFGWEQVAQKARVVYRDAIRFHNQEHDVTVVIPSYNKGKTVERAVKSALNQEFPPSEIIVVNNNSTDGTDFDRIAELHETVMVVNEPRQGVAHARNLGISLARTRYVCCLDGDDEIEDEFLRVCVGALENDRSLGLAYTKLKAMFPDGREIVSEWPGEYNFDQFLVRKNQIPTCCVFRKDLADKLGGFRQRYAPRGAGSEDAEFWMRMGAMGYPGKLVTSDALFLYHTGGATSQEGYSEADWHVWHPWTRDRDHPFASAATPIHHSHPVKQLDRPKISVVIPVAENHGDLVIDALDSIEAQEMRHWEAIVAWDQESDVPESLKVAYPFVKFIHTRGKGAGYARNRGAELASARLLLFL
ncbi:MAG: glycosyltransferase, partial [Planctomycetota bacterium]